MSDSGRPAAGWYDDPELVNTRRYWDGQQWTGHRQEREVPPPVVPTKAEDEWPGWVENASIPAAIIVPVVGLILGVWLLAKKPAKGAQVIGLSLVSSVVWFLVVGRSLIP